MLKIVKVSKELDTLFGEPEQVKRQKMILIVIQKYPLLALKKA